MNPKIPKRSAAFTTALILFYIFLYTGLGSAGSISMLLPFSLSALSAWWALKIIQSPHLVEHKNSKVPSVLYSLSVILPVIILISGASHGLLGLMGVLPSACGYFITFFTLGFFIRAYKLKGQERVIMPEEPVLPQPEEITPTARERLEESLQRAIVFTSPQKSYRASIIRDLDLIREIGKNKIVLSDKIIEQILEITNAYNELVDDGISTRESLEAIDMIGEEFPKIESALEEIYNRNVKDITVQARISSEVLDNMLTLNGLKRSDFRS